MEKLQYITNEIATLLTNKRFLLNILGIFVFLTVVLIGTFVWLRIYTNHGQKLELPTYLESSVDEAIVDASKKSFEIIVNDSVHIVGKKGGLVIHQNPPGGSLVKEERKIYVTITKYDADQVNLSEMMFFGQEYDQVVASLKRKSISSEIKDYKYDPLTQNSILEVWYNDEEVISRSKNPDNFIVDKGSTLEFVVSSLSGGTSEVPDLLQDELGSAIFRLTPLRLQIEVVNKRDFGDRDLNEAIIIEQYPSAGTSLSLNESVKVKVAIQN